MDSEEQKTYDRTLRKWQGRGLVAGFFSPIVIAPFWTSITNALGSEIAIGLVVVIQLAAMAYFCEELAYRITDNLTKSRTEKRK
ncbi:MAG: hypothetical protein AAF582_00050 [Pseudomonadota bacterium]